MRYKIDTIIITYNPNVQILKNCINSIKSQVRRIIIIDNNSNYNISSYFDNSLKGIQIIKLKENKGISYALNLGIRESLKNNPDYILLSDQDSVYPPNYVNNMIQVFEEYKDKRIIAVAPLFKDIHKKQKDEGFYKKTLLGFKKFYPKKGIHEIYQAISSGMIIDAKLMKKEKLFFNEKLFIDWVDFEWCWRVNKRGYKILGNADIIITHSLGNKKKDLKYREINLRNPIRHYYITRNAFYLSLRDKDISIIQRIFLFLTSFKYIIGFTILSKPHLKNLKYVLKGFIHGMFGKMGKFTD